MLRHRYGTCCRQAGPEYPRLIEGTDLLIYDCTYTDKEFKGKIGWGHSTWQEGIRLARAADAGIDLGQAMQAKLATNEKRYPADRARGRHNKYTDYQPDDE